MLEKAEEHGAKQIAALHELGIKKAQRTPGTLLQNADYEDSNEVNRARENRKKDEVLSKEEADGDVSLYTGENSKGGIQPVGVLGQLGRDLFR